MVSTPAAVKEIFLAALDKATQEERAAYLQSACEGDEALRREVEVLLAAHDQPDSRLDQPRHVARPSLAATSLPDNSTRIGTMVGPYKLHEQIGEGGMGLVYMAEQQRPMRRLVAVKVVKPGMDSRQVITRFEAERQALAMMDHPNIARVLDAGTTETGHPYFVMELVRGIPINEFCDQKRLTVRERLELMIQVCQAVQHAHQKGIIHRDLKPTNVLVTMNDATPLPKVIDFGIAKALGQQLSEHTLLTGFAQMIGTPLYMSPEQAEMNQFGVDTRSDVYSLGVMLYELLTGTTPFDKETLTKAGLDEMRRIIREQEPPRPSARLSTLAAPALSTISNHRSVDPRRISLTLRGELDWIVMQALEKDRSRRYESASALAADIQRYLSDEPVQACPPSAAYRLSKLARRHKAALTTAALLTAALVLGTIVSSWQAVRATSAEIQAKANEAHALLAATAERAAKQSEAAQRARAEANEAKAREEEQKARAAADQERKAKQQETDARKRAQAAEADTKAFADFLVNNVLAAPRPTGLQLGQGISVTVAAALEAAEPKLEKTFAGRPKAEAIARDALGKTWRNLAQFARAEADLRRALEIRQRELGPDHRDTLESANSLSVCLEQMGRYAEAIVIQERTVELSKAKRGPDDTSTLQFMKNLAGMYGHLGQFDDAMKLCEATYDLAKTKLGADHPTTLTSAAKLAEMYEKLGRLDEAIPLMEKTLELYKRKLSAEHPETLITMHNLGHMYLAAGKTDLALALLEQSLRLNRTTFGVDHPNTMAAMNSVASAYKAAGRFVEAQQLYEGAFKLARAKLGSNHPDTLTVMNNLGKAYWDAGKAPEAVKLGEELLTLRKAKVGPDHPQTLETMNNLALWYESAGKPVQGLPLMQEALTANRANLGQDHPQTLACLANLAFMYDRAAEFTKSEDLFREAIPLYQDKLGPEHLYTLMTMSGLGLNLLHQQRYIEAASQLRQCLEILERSQPDHWETFNARSRLGGALLGQANVAQRSDEMAAEKKIGEAEPFLHAGYEGLKTRDAKIPAPKKKSLTEALHRLVDLYTAWNKPDEAAKWQKELEARVAEQPR